jgi:ferric-dicitrate binding protein FerR (iron transport regulator)
MKPFNKALLRKFEQGTCTHSEYQQVLTWLGTADGRAYLSAQMDKDISAAESNPDLLSGQEVDSEGIFERIQKARAGAPIRRLPSSLPPSGRKNYRTWWAAAASIALLMAITLVLYYRLSPTVYATAYSETQTVRLPDGTEVKLNAHSSLRLSREWADDKAREVWLEGEAFFSVTHQRNHQQFVVHTEGLDVEVLGTEFNVNTRRGKTRVVLKTGKVALKGIGSEGSQTMISQTMIMKPKEMVELTHSTKDLVKKTVNPLAYTSWQGTRQLFDNTSLREIVWLLEDNYGLHVECRDPALLDEKISGEIEVETADDLLKGVAESLNLSVTRRGNQVMLTAR